MRSVKKQARRYIRMGFAALSAAIVLNAAPALGGAFYHSHAYATEEAAAHPVDYWWNLDPSNAGNWDYFTPRDHPYEPLPVRIYRPVAIPAAVGLAPAVPAGVGAALPSHYYGGGVVPGVGFRAGAQVFPGMGVSASLGAF